MMIDNISGNSKESISIAITDQNRLIIWVNHHFTSMTGYTLAEVHGRKPSIIQARDLKDTPKMSQTLPVNIEGKPIENKITSYRKNGEKYTCTLTIQPVFSVVGDLTNYVAYYVNSTESQTINISSSVSVEKYKTSNLSEDEEERIYNELRSYFESDQPYLDASLTQSSVAQQIGTNEKYLSQVINKQTGKNFRYFVNQFRVDAFEQLLENKEFANLTLFGIAENCGFQNKATFHNVIVNHTGVTPKAIASRYN